MTTRKSIRRSWILAFCILWTAIGASAQDRYIGIAQGLSNNFVLAVALDGEGNVWVGTEAGLNCIAGQTVTCYRREQLGGLNDKILSLYYDRRGDRMMVGTERGMLVYDRLRNTFCPEPSGKVVATSGLNAMADDHRHGIWLVFANGTIQHLDCTDNQVTTLRGRERLRVGASAGDERMAEARCAMDDGQGRLYVGHSREGMSIVSLKNPADTRQFRHREDDDTSLPGNNVRCITKDSGGRIWVGTDRGVALFHPETGRFSNVRHPDTQRPGDNVFDIKEMADGLLWVASDVGGISVISRELTFRDDVHIATSSMNTRCILQDKYQNVWVGNHSTGLDFIAGKQSLLHTLDYKDDNHRQKRIYGLTNDRTGRIWMSSEDELSLWTADGDELRQQGRWRITGMKHRAHSFARCLMADSKGYVWLGMEDEGVIRFDSKTGRFEPIDIGYDLCDIHSFYEDTDGSVWIGAERGTCIWEDTKGYGLARQREWARGYGGAGARGRVRHLDDIDHATNKAPITSVVRLSDDELLLATQGNGLVIVGTKTRTKRHLSMEDGLPSNNINQALADGQGAVWLATSEGIIHIPDVKDIAAGAREPFKTYTEKEGLTDHQVRAIQNDSQGRIWGTTYTSLFCLDPATGRFHNYVQQSGRSVNGFMEGAVARTADGMLVFGSPEGACYLQPETNGISQKVSPLRITLCEVFYPAEEDNIRRLITPDNDGRLTLDHQQNTLRIAYTIEDYAQTDETEYSYMMKGLSDKWYYNGSDHDVMFRSLSPGHYTFVLRAKLKSQDWEEATTTQIDIRIAPPFWLSWLAWIVYALAAMAIAGWLIRQYKRRLALHNSLQMARMENRQKQELNEERLRFFTNITHELRTPLTLILGPLDDLAADRGLTDSSRRKVEMIQKSAQRLHDLTSEILEFRKTETQNRRLTVARGDLGTFVREICLNYKELFRNPRVQFTYGIADNLPPVYFDSEVITTILNNLLSNAIKFTEEGSISVAVRAADGRLSISVADTGYGIAPDALPHIFERYYQAKGSHQASGTGIGLALVKSLADLHEASLTAESHENRGSTFTFSLSVANTYPTALHKEDAEGASGEFRVESLEFRVEKGAGARERREEVPILLIVEDNDDIRQYIADSFASDFQILQAENGEKGAEIALKKVPDIIVSDIMMPKMNGIQLTRLLKEDMRTSHIPIILLTAKTTDADKEEGYDSGADSYLTKPFTAKLLGSRIQNLLTARRRLAERLFREERGERREEREMWRENGEEGKEEMSRLDREFLDKLNGIIRDNIMSKDIDLPFITDKMAMSHSTFYRKIKALTGMTAQEYIRKFRLQHCYRLLKSGDYNVTEAAMMTGFNQMAHFREIFKKEFGILPSEVMKK